MVRQAEETSGQGTLDPSPGGAEEATLEVVTGEWASMSSSADAYQRSRSCSPRTGSCQGRIRPGPEGDLQQEVRDPLHYLPHLQGATGLK